MAYRKTVPTRRLVGPNTPKIRETRSSAPYAPKNSTISSVCRTRSVEASAEGYRGRSADGAQRRNRSEGNLALFPDSWGWRNSRTSQQKYQQNISVDWFGFSDIARSMPSHPKLPSDSDSCCYSSLGPDSPLDRVPCERPESVLPQLQTAAAVRSLLNRDLCADAPTVSSPPAGHRF